MIAPDTGGKRAQTAMAMTISALMMAHQVAGKASRDAIFLSNFNATDLPAMVVVAAIASVAASALSSRILVRFGPRRLVPASFALSSVLQFAEWVLLRASPRLAACIIYLHVVAFGAVLLSGFWSAMNESFEPRSAKQLFGKIGGMGTLGGLCGGLLAERVAAFFGAAEVVVLLALLHMLCAGLLWRAFPWNGPLHGPHKTGAARETHFIDAVQRYPFLLVLAGLVIAASSATALLDFVFKAQAAQTIGRGAPLLRFLGVYYTGASLLTFLLQTFFVQVSLRRAGLAASVAIAPVTVSMGSVACLFFPGFASVAVARATEIMLRGSLYRSAYELFYGAIPPAEKRTVKSLIDVGADRAGDAVGSAGVSLMLVLSPGRYGPILALASVLSIVAVLLASRLRAGYLRALEKSLVERAIELDPSLIEDSATRSVLMRSVALPTRPAAQEATALPPAPHSPAPADAFLRRASDLRSGDAPRVIRAAREIGPNDWTLAPVLIELLAWDETIAAARDALVVMGPKITGMLVDVLLDPERDFVVRRRVPRVLAFVPSARTVEGLYDALEDSRFEVRFYAGRALYLLQKEHSHLNMAAERLWAAMNRELSLQRPVWESHRLLDRRPAHEKAWFFDQELLDRADRNLEHLFTLLSLLLPGNAVRIAFRALHTNDRQLKGTAFEYLESAIPADTRNLLLPMLEADAENRLHAAAGARPLENLLASKARINKTLKLALTPLEADQ